MGLFTDTIKRSKNDLDKKEDFSLLYSDEKDIVKSDIYRNYTYDIVSSGNSYPGIIINAKYLISYFSGYTEVKLKDHQGSLKLVERTGGGPPYFYIYYYNSDSDYTGKNKLGSKHSLKSIEEDTRSFIDDIIEHEKKLFEIID